jgi:hypothetical protein
MWRAFDVLSIEHWQVSMARQMSNKLMNRRHNDVLRGRLVMLDKDEADGIGGEVLAYNTLQRHGHDCKPGYIQLTKRLLNLPHIYQYE